MATLYQLVELFDKQIGQNTPKKPSITIHTFTQILYEIRGLNQNGKQTQSQKQSQKVEKQPNKKQKKEDTISLSIDEYSELISARRSLNLLKNNSLEFHKPPTYTQCLAK